MRKFIAMTLIAAFVFAAQAMPAYASPQTGVVTASALNVRTAPSTDASTLGLLPYGTSVQLVERVGEWYKINFQNQAGYIFGTYVSVKEPTAYDKRMQLLEIAKTYIGTPYLYGGTTPSGFDCSGFVQYVYNKMGISLPRTSYSQATVGTQISYENLVPGDIVCFGYDSINHVGIYVGDGMYIHSPQTGYTVCIAPMATRVANGNFRYGRRIIN